MVEHADPPLVHLAIVRRVYLEQIVRGSKRAEARLSKQRRVPYKGLDRGDVVYFKETGGPIGARAVVACVHRFELSAVSTVDGILERFGGMLGDHSGYFESKADARYAAIIELEGVTPIRVPPPWYVPSPGRSAWRVLSTA